MISRTVAFLCRCLALVVLLSFSSATTIEAAITVAWSANPESDIAGYVVSYGTTSRSYTGSVDVGNSTSFQFLQALPGQTYYFAIRAYNVGGLHSDYSEEVAFIPASDLTIISLSPDRPSPQISGTVVTFSAALSGGVAPYQYRWNVTNGATTSVAIQDWNASNSFAWRAPESGSYAVTVSVRDSDGEMGTSVSRTIPFSIGARALSVVSLAPNALSPQPVSTAIAFSASVSGGEAPYQFKFFVGRDNKWTIARDWSTSSSFTWSPSSIGSYYVAVWVRNASSSSDLPDSEAAAAAVPFQVVDPFLRMTGLTSSKPAPQAAGSTVVFTASSIGSAAPEYRWWVFDGVSWTVRQDWSQNPRFAWTPRSANVTYWIAVRVRDASGKLMMMPLLTTLAGPFPIIGLP